VRQLQWWEWERVGRGKLLLRCRLLGGAQALGAHGGGEGRGHIVAAARLQLVLFTFSVLILLVGWQAGRKGIRPVKQQRMLLIVTMVI